MRANVKEGLALLSADGRRIARAALCKHRPEQAKKMGIDCVQADMTSFHASYQAWYTKSVRALGQLAPERLREFIECYEPDPKRKVFNYGGFRIKDFMQNLVSRFDDFDTFDAFFTQFQHQILILEAVLASVDDKIFRIEETLKANIFDKEIETAEELLGKGHVRAAGAVAGVVLESHLEGACRRHSITLRKKAPAISDFNEALKASGKVDIPTWRLIQRLADIRNLSVHAKERPPSADELRDLISGTKKIITEVF